MCSLLYFSVTNQILLTNSLPTVLLCFLVSSDLKTFEESSLFQGIALAWLGVLGREGRGEVGWVCVLMGRMPQIYMLP